MISDVAKAKTLPEGGAIASLEKPVMNGTVEVIEDIRESV
jgi:hypothetical protein